MNSPISVIFFFVFFKKIIQNYNNKIKCDIVFFKKKTLTVFMIKSNIRYKVSKHITQKNSNRFFFKLDTNYNIKWNNFMFGFKKYCMFSSVYLNLNYFKFKKNIFLNKFLTFFC